MLNIGFIGIGNCGNQIGAIAFDEKKIPTFGINASEKDLESITSEFPVYVLGDKQGCGKDRKIAMKFVKKYAPELIKNEEFNSFLNDVDLVFVGGSTGGGTGSGMLSVVAEIIAKVFKKKVIIVAVLPTLEEKGVSINDVVWEDLGDRTNVFNEIYYGKFNLPSIKQLEWDKGESADYNDTSLISSHDSPPTRMMNLNTWDKEYLVGYLKPDPAKRDEQAQFRQAISTNPLELIKAKFVDLFRSSKNIQMSFADFFAIDQRYNIPGQMNNSNWKLRMNNNYIDTYYKNLSSENPTAPNIPELLAQAVQSKVDMSVAKKNDKNPQEAAELRERLNREAQPLISHLNELAAFLKKPEPTEQLDLVA